MKVKIIFAMSIPCLASASIVHAQEAQTVPMTFPADFRGMVVYDGIVKGTAVITPSGGADININGGNMQFNLGGLLNRALNRRTVPLHGSWHVEAEYEGNMVRGRSVVQSEIDGLSEDVSFVGTRNGDLCNLSFNGEAFQRLTCTPIRFESNVDYTNQNQQKIKASYIASRTSAVDYVERDRLAAIEKAKREQAAAEAAARYAALPNAGVALTKKLDQLVQVDSQEWAFNQYLPGSMRNVKILSGKPGSGTYVIRGEYTYNGNQVGWVMAEMNGPNLSCIQFWDAVMGCRGLRAPGQGQAMRSALIGTILDSAGEFDTGENCDDQCQGEIAERNHRNSVVRHPYNDPR